MRAHFAGDVVVSNGGDSCDDAIETEPLETRINDFKQDSQNMEVLSEFIDDVLQKAEKEAVKKKQDETAPGNNKKGGSQQTKEKSRQSFTIPDFKNGKVVNRARGLVVRIFDAICNCANSAAGPAQRIKLRGKRASAKEQQATTESEKLQAAEKGEEKQQQQKAAEAGEQKQS